LLISVSRFSAGFDAGEDGARIVGCYPLPDRFLSVFMAMPMRLYWVMDGLRFWVGHNPNLARDAVGPSTSTTV
jgi:hypothetical protein